MHKTKVIEAKCKVLAMYYNDNNNHYNGIGGAKYYSTDELCGYFPIIDLININLDENLRFSNGININQEITVYNSNNSFRKLTPNVIASSRIDVTQNDIILSPVRILLNLTDRIITTNDMYGNRKTFVPVINDKLAGLKGKVYIMNIHSINNPKSLQNVNGIANYIEPLAERYKHTNNLMVDEISKVYNYVNDKWSIIGNGNNATVNATNSIKVVTITEISELDIVAADTHGINIVPYNIHISLENIVNINSEIENMHKHITEKSILEVMRKNSFCCYIVDNNDMLGDRYINIAGVVSKIPKLKMKDFVNGLYIYYIDEHGKNQNEQHFTIDKIDESGYVYKSAEEANEGADVKTKYQNRLDEKLREFELFKLAKNKEVLDAKNQIETETARLKLEYESKIRSLEEEATLAKRDFEKNKWNREDNIERYRNHMEYRSMDRKDHSEELKYNRDSGLETLKMIGGICGVIAGGYLIFNKLSK